MSTFHLAYPRQEFARNKTMIPPAAHLVPGRRRYNKTTFCGRSARSWLWDEDPMTVEETLVALHLCKTCLKAAEPEIQQRVAFRILSGVEE